MSNLDEVNQIIANAERLLVDASEQALTNPIHTRVQIAAAIEQIHAVRGFLL